MLVDQQFRIHGRRAVFISLLFAAAGVRAFGAQRLWHFLRLHACCFERVAVLAFSGFTVL